MRVEIVVLDKIRGYLNWMNEWFREAAERDCSTACTISESKENLSRAGIVLFHAPTHEYNFPRHKPKNSLYVLVSLEQPKYAKLLNDKRELSKFDLLVTYSQKDMYPGTVIPNLPVTYFPLNILSPKSILQPPRPFSQKDGFGSGANVALFTSNCHAAGASSRFEYVQQLLQFIKIDSYGKCLNNRQEPNFPDDPAWPSIAQRRARKVKILSRYKFYLAFENLGVEDYVSEKVFEGLFAGAVPVYRGSPSIHHFMPGNHSFINANELDARSLAEKLLYLSTHELEYNSFFSFKNERVPAEFEAMALKSYTHPNVLCRLCDYFTSKSNLTTLK